MLDRSFEWGLGSVGLLNALEEESLRGWCALLLVACAALAALSCGRGEESGHEHAATTMFARPVLGGRLEQLVTAAFDRDATDEERACVAHALVEDSVLVDALGEDASRSARIGELRGVGERCASTVSNVGATMADLRAHAKGGLSDGQAGCLQSALVRYSVEDQRVLREAGVLGIGTGALRDRVNELLMICGVQRSLFE